MQRDSFAFSKSVNRIDCMLPPIGSTYSKSLYERPISIKSTIDVVDDTIPNDNSGDRNGCIGFALGLFAAFIGLAMLLVLAVLVNFIAYWIGC